MRSCSTERSFPYNVNRYTNAALPRFIAWCGKFFLIADKNYGTIIYRTVSGCRDAILRLYGKCDVELFSATCGIRVGILSIFAIQNKKQKI